MRQLLKPRKPFKTLTNQQILFKCIVCYHESNCSVCTKLQNIQIKIMKK